MHTNCMSACCSAFTESDLKSELCQNITGSCKEIQQDRDAEAQGYIRVCIGSQVTQKTACLIKLTPVIPKTCRRLIFHSIAGHMADEY